MIWLAACGGYFLIALAVWCLGAFGIAVTGGDRWEGVVRHNKTRTYDRESRARSEYLYRRAELVAVTVAVGLFWPVGVPLYLAARKGTLISRELQRRQDGMGNE